MNLGVPLTLVAAGKLASAFVAGKGLFTRVRADVCGQVVTAAKAAHADAALEGLLAGVHADMAGQLVGSREATLAAFSRADMWSLLRWRLALPPSAGLSGAAGLGQLTRMAQARGGGALDLGEGFDGGEWSEWQGC